MVIKMILYQIHSISNSFISNNNERKNKTKMRATSAPHMNQISQHVLYTRQTKFIMAESNILQNQRFLYKKSKTIWNSHVIFADSKTNLWQMKKTKKTQLCNVDVSSSFQQQMALVLRMFQFSTKNIRMMN